MAHIQAKEKKLRTLNKAQKNGPPPPAPPGGPGSVNWTPLGPSVQAHSDATGNPPVSGRVNGIAVGPSGMRAYAGTVDGGVWFTANGGILWQPLEESEVSSPTSGLDSDAQGVTSLDVRFGSGAATDIIAVACGRPSNLAIRYSNNGGTTWLTEVTNFLGAQVFRILIDPDNSALVFVATSSGLFHRVAANNWQAATNPSFGPTDIAIAGSGANKRYYAAYPNGQIFVSPDFATWSLVPNASAVPASQRVILAVAESSASVVYALDDNAVLRRLVGGTFQTITGVPKAALLPGNQGVGDLILAVDPSDPNTIYLGGDRTNGVEAALFKGTLNSTTFTFPFNPANTANPAADPSWIGQGIHADVHSFGFALNATGTAHISTDVWVGCDGGLWQSTASGAKGTFVAFNTGLSTLFMRQMAQRVDMDSVLFGASLDNGSFRLFGEQAAMQIGGGDAGGVAVDPNDGYNIMVCTAGNGVVVSSDGGYNWGFGNFPPAGDSNESFSLGSAIFTSPKGVTPTQACIGTNRVWLTTQWGNAGSWVTLPTNTNPYLLAPPQRYSQDQLDAFVYSIAVVSDSLIFAATAKTVYRFDRSGATWTKTALNMSGIPAGITIASIAVDNAAAGSLFLTLGVFDGKGFDHVWHCSGSGLGNAGTGFVSVMSKSQLDCPVNAVVVDPANPQIVYIGSDVGVWKGTLSSGSWTWVLFSSGLPESGIGINGLAIHAPARLLRATTTGRGIWEIPLDATSGTNPDIYLRVNYADNGRRQSWVEGAPDPTSKGFKVYHWMSSDIKVYRSSLGPPAFTGLPDYLAFAFNIGDWIDSTTHTETADQSGMDRIYVEVHNRGLTSLPAGQVRVCLLLTTVGSAGVPSLPGGYVNSINIGDTSNWLSGTPWVFADPTKYKFTTGPLDARTPQIVEFDVDFSAIGLSPGDHVCAAAFVTTVGSQDQLPMPGNTNLDQLTLQDKHVAQRNLHLVTSGSKPAPPPSRYPFFHPPATFLINFNNAEREARTVDLVFQRPNFSGHMSVMLPKLDISANSQAVQGFDVMQHSKLETAIATHLGHWLGDIGEVMEEAGEAIEATAAKMARDVLPSEIEEVKKHNIARLDRSRVYVAKDTPVCTVGGVRLPAGGHITAAVTVQAPPESKPGDRFRFDIIQQSGNRIIGGSSYVFAVTKPR
jgi:hypothetical protein